MRSAIWRICYVSCDSFFAFMWDRVFPHFNAWTPAPGALELVPQMPQRRHPSPAGETQKISVRAVRHRVRLKGALGEAVYAAYLLRPRACPQRRTDSL